MPKPPQHLLSSMILALLFPAALACAPDERDDSSTAQSSVNALQLNYAPAQYGIDRMWDQQGRQLLVPTGAYLIGAKSGPDNPDTNFWTKGGSATHMTNSHGQLGPAYSMNTARVNATTIAFNMSIGPLPFDFQTLSLSFDWDQARITKFRYAGAGFSDDCRPGFFAQTEAFFDELPQCHLVKNDQGVVVAQVGAAKVRPPSPWVEFEGNFDGKIRITFNSTGGGHFNGFFNHSHSHAFGLEFGDDAPAPQGAVYAVSGTIELLPTNSQPVGPSAPRGPETLNAGQTLSAGQSLTSANGRYSATLQGDGNFVVYDGTSPTWSTRTDGRAGTTATMQNDGNFVLYQNGTVVLFATGTNGRAGAALTLQNDGALQVVFQGSVAWSSSTTGTPAPTPTPTPTPSTGGSTVSPDTTLNSGDVVTSPNGSVVLTMQGDGNLVLSRDGNVIWATATNGHPNSHAVMQGDGNFVLYESGGAVLWHTHTNGRAGARLLVQDDGNLVIAQGAQIVWAR